jgi:hypothetical protein
VQPYELPQSMADFELSRASHRQPMARPDADARKPSPALRESLRRILEAGWDMAGSYLEMREANTKMSDKYFHCRANCEAAALGPEGEWVAEFIGDIREQVDLYKNTWLRDMPESTSRDDCARDLEANREGRDAGRWYDTLRDVDGDVTRREYCRDSCESLRPGALDEKY